MVEGLTTINRHSVIGANKYAKLEMPKDTIKEVMDGRNPKLLMNIHNVSGVNNPNIYLSELDRPAHIDDFAKPVEQLENKSTQQELIKEEKIAVILQNEL